MKGARMMLSSTSTKPRRAEIGCRERKARSAPEEYWFALRRERDAVLTKPCADIGAR
jgi:hypothetical protein